MKKHQATRNGQYIGEPKNDRPAAQQVVCDDRDFTMKAYKDGWITKEHLGAIVFHRRFRKRIGTIQGARIWQITRRGQRITVRSDELR